MTIDAYLQKLAVFVDDEYGRQIRRDFADHRGWGELAMLQSPSADDLAQLSRAVAIMTPGEKRNAHELTDEQIEKIATEAMVDPAIFAIFMNGYTLQRKPVS